MRYLLLLLIFTGCYYTPEEVSETEQPVASFQASFFHNKQSGDFTLDLTHFPEGKWYQNCYYQERIDPDSGAPLYDIGSINLIIDHQKIEVRYRNHYDLDLNPFQPPEMKTIGIEKTASDTLAGDQLSLNFPKSPDIPAALPDPVEINPEEGVIFQIDREYPYLVGEITTEKKLDSGETVTGRLSCYFTDSKYLFMIKEQLALLPDGAGTVTIGGVARTAISHRGSVHHYRIISGYRSLIKWSE